MAHVRSRPVSRLKRNEDLQEFCHLLLPNPQKYINIMACMAVAMILHTSGVKALSISRDFPRGLVFRP